MDPSQRMSRSGSHNSVGSGILDSSRHFSRSFGSDRSAGSGRFNRVAAAKVEPDIEEASATAKPAIGGSPRRSSSFGVDHSERRRSSQTLGKFGSQSSVSVLDTIAAGGNIETTAYYDVYVKNLSYKVTVNSRKKGTEEKILLNNVNAEAIHGQVLAVVGPSGSGKTTFLDALAGRVARKSLEGEVFINGELVDDSFKRISGYVMQDDALFPMLTAQETLLYSARLRLPNTMSLAEKKVRVDNMINQLGLTQCADNIVGNEKVRGVSGGERRRVSIGADLIHDPAVLFLDEPTSGLDSTSALNVMQNLQKMARSGRRTVILTIHQPSYRILGTIDKVLVLGRGYVIYHGAHEGIQRFFDPLGRSMPEFVNVIEYALDTIEDYQRSPEGLEPLIRLQAANKKVEDENPAQDRDQSAFEMAPEYATSFFSECFVLTSRNFKNTIRTPELFLSRLATMIIVAAMVGTLFLRVGISEKGVRQRQSFFAFAIAILIFTSTEAMGIFIDERQILIRETSRGAYRASSYVIAGAFVTLPLLLILSIVFTVTGYFIVGLVPTAGAFFFFILLVWLTLCMANSFVSFVSGLVPNFSIGNSICSALFAYFFLFSGFFIQRAAIPKYWIWIHYLSLFKYPYESMMKNEIGNKRFDNVIWYSNLTSESVLISFSAGAVHQYISVIAMVLIAVGYRVFFWLTLKYMTKSIRD